MPTYLVTVSRTMVQTATVRVEAPSPEDAEAEVKACCKDEWDDPTHDFDVDEEWSAGEQEGAVSVDGVREETE